AADPQFIGSLDNPGDAVRLRAVTYIEREGDRRLRNELARPSGTTATIRAPRQMGKSSLLFRGIAQAQAQGSNVVFIDLQNVEDNYLQSLDLFLRNFATLIITRFNLDTTEVEKAWRSSLSPSDKTTYLMEDYVLRQAGAKLMLAIDEADRLLKTPFHDTFFGLLRSWHNQRALSDIWEKVDIVIVISTEPHLLIKDRNQSPFNVALKILLEDFNEMQVRELNRHYRSPVDDRDIPALVELLNGHPYLTSRALYTIL